jgi:hypothetical protein
MGNKILVNVYVTPEVYGRIEITRGETPRSTFLSKVIENAVIL